MANYQLLDALISQNNARTYTFLETFGMSQLRFNHTPDPQNLFLLTNKLWNLVPKVSDRSFLSCTQKYCPAYNIRLN